MVLETKRFFNRSWVIHYFCMFCVTAPCTLHINSKMTPSQRWKAEFKGHWTLWFFPLYHNYRKPVLNNMMLVCCENSQYLCSSHISCCPCLLVLMVLAACLVCATHLCTARAKFTDQRFLPCTKVLHSPLNCSRHGPKATPLTQASLNAWKLNIQNQIWSSWLTDHALN